MITKLIMLTVTATVLILCVAVSIQATRSSVILTVNYEEVGDISNNKTVRVMLLCEGMNLNQLRWSYPPLSDVNNEITPYVPDTAPDTAPVPVSPNINPPFLTVQLLDVNKSPDNLGRANFSSILTFDLLELRLNVIRIVCGDIATFEEILVSDLVDEVIKPQPRVTATYQQGILTDIRVQLNNLFLCYPIVMYTVSITGSAETRSVHIDSCTGPFCEVRFTAPNLHYDEEGNTHLTVSLLTNQQTTKTVSIQINQRSDSYFLPQVNSSDCFHTPECRRVLNESLSPCTVQYSTSLLPTLPTVPPSLDTPLPQQTPGTLHTFNFSLQLNEQLYITESINVTDSVPSLETWEIAILTMTCIFLLLTLAHFVMVINGVYYKIEIITSKKKELIVSMVLLTLLVLVCISLLIALGVIQNSTACGSVESSPQESILETMIAITTLGCALLLAIWSYLGYTVYQRQKAAGLCKQDEERKDAQIVDDKEKESSTIHHDNGYYGIQKSTSKENISVQDNAPHAVRREDSSTIHHDNVYYDTQGPTTNKNPANPQEYQYVAVEPKRHVKVPADQTVDNENYQPHDESTNEDKKDDSSMIHHQNVCYGTQISS